MRKKISMLLFVACVCCFVTGFGMSLAFYSIGSLVPDPSTGRTYPVNLHGIMYVSPVQGEAMNALLFAAIILAIAAYLVRHGISGKKGD